MKGNSKTTKKGGLLLTTERNEFILRQLAEHGAARTTLLAKAMNVTDETVRNDLIRLEQRGYLMRVHGGAVPIAKKISTNTSKIHTARDVDLAKAVVRYLQPKTTVFLDGGIFGGLIASYLPANNMTIVTNSPIIFNQLKDEPHINIYATGGLFDRESNLFLGRRAVESISHMAMDLAILIADSFIPGRGPGFTNLGKADFFEAIVPLVRSFYVVCPASAYQENVSYFPISSSNIHKLMTIAENIGNEDLITINREGIQVEVV